MDNNYNAYIIPQEIKSEIMLMKGVYLTDIVIIFSIYFVLDMFKGYVYEPIQLVYTIWTFLLGFIVTRRVSSNPNKKMYHVLLFKILHKNETYHRREKKITTAEFEKEKYNGEEK